MFKGVNGTGTGGICTVMIQRGAILESGARYPYPAPSTILFLHDDKAQEERAVIVGVRCGHCGGEGGLQVRSG